MASAYDIRCSNVCTRVGITVLILSAISLVLIKPLDKSRELESLLRYTSARPVLVEEIARLDKDLAWRGLMATGTAEQARKEWNLMNLVNYGYSHVTTPSRHGAGN
jgi:hypothetical protein